MRAIQFSARGVADTTDLPCPDIRPGHALVRIRAAGLCHTDIEVLHGRYGIGAFPLVPGHEYSGVVEAVARDVDAVKPGDRVAIDPNIPCGHCRQCRKGLSNLCAELKAYGVTQNGGFAEFSLVAADHLHDIGDLAFDTAALAEPLACVLNGLGAAGVEEGHGGLENALVFGAGPIGLLLAFSLRAMGASRVAIVDVNEKRLSLVQDFGFEPLMSGSESLSRERHGFDFVADATGIASVVEGMIGYTADGGTALVFGVCAPDAAVSISPFEIFRRQIRIAGSHSLNRNIPEALRILERDAAMARLVTHRLSLAEMLPFFSKDSDATTMKVQFVPE
jgi:threonine dehydrogenase-like Zn-dependent dehydrogenase